MEITARLSSKGQVTVPRVVRSALSLEPPRSGPGEGTGAATRRPRTSSVRGRATLVTDAAARARSPSLKSMSRV